MPEKYDCGESFAGTDETGTVTSMCTCCGELCNGHQIDYIVKACSDVPGTTQEPTSPVTETETTPITSEPTTEMPESTTHVEPMTSTEHDHGDCPEDTGPVVGGILGTFFALSMLGNIYCL